MVKKKQFLPSSLLHITVNRWKASQKAYSAF